MTTIDPGQRPARRRATNHRQAVTLVLLIFFIVLVAALAALMAASTSQLVRTTRYEHESIVVRQLAESAFALVRTRTESPAMEPITLGGIDVLPDGTTGEVHVARTGDPNGQISVSVQARFASRSIERVFRRAAHPD
jgi:Tfp pilus assembly protein FimT